MSKVQFNCRLDEEVVKDIVGVSERLTVVEKRKVSQAELVEKAWRARVGMCDGQRVVEWFEDSERRSANVAFTDGVERQLAYRFEDLFQRVDELEGAVAKLNGGEVPVGDPVVRIPPEADQSTRAAVAAEILERTTSSESASTFTRSNQNHCIHCDQDFPRPDGTKPTSMCQDCRASGHWNTVNCQKCAERDHRAKLAAADKVAAAGRNDIEYD